MTRAASVLLVDDDTSVTETVRRMLTLEGYEVRSAPNAERGLSEARSWSPDAIILDLHMPAMDGVGFLRRLRQEAGQRNTPVAMVTGDYFLDEATETEVRGLGAEVLFKPLWLDDLVALTKRLVPSAPTDAA